MSRIKLPDYIAKKRDGRQTHIELSDGTILRIDPLELWSDDVLENADKAPIKAAIALVGSEEDYAKFKADGGTAALLLSLVLDQQEVSKGEAKPSPS